MSSFWLEVYKRPFARDIVREITKRALTSEMECLATSFKRTRLYLTRSVAFFLFTIMFKALTINTTENSYYKLNRIKCYAQVLLANAIQK